MKFEVNINELIACGLKGEHDAYRRAMTEAVAIGGAVKTRFEESTRSWYFDVIPPHDLYAEPDDQNPLKK